MRKNEILTLTITDITLQGAGIARHEGQVVFIPGTAVGDTVKAVIIKPKENYAIGKLLQVLEPSPDRAEVDCPCFPACGGCDFRHLKYEAELRLKEDNLRETLRRIGGIEVPVRPIRPSAEICRYRNKTFVPVGLDKDGKLIGGFYARGTHRIVPCASCLLEKPSTEHILRTVMDWAVDCGVSIYDEQSHTGLLRHIMVRYTQDETDVGIGLVINGNSIPRADLLIRNIRAKFKNIRCFLLVHNTERTNVVNAGPVTILWGNPILTEKVCGLTFEVSPKVFMQINHAQMEVLYAVARGYALAGGGAPTGHERPVGAVLSDKPILLDLYCGAGTIGLTMADACKEVIGVELVEPSVKDAIRNAKKNGIQNARFLQLDASMAAAKLAREGVEPDIVIVDPPRKGCEESLLRIITHSFRPARLVYISCDPATLARDLRYIAANGYTVREVTPVDMFPRTGHVESCCLCVRDETAAESV
ncbi:MAG: 23S rRNA (uracil(1939)-C(5))-methyltransferase RlmD [Oscillospiraceae bacterium]|jgi:23S rRNA (uracil1939-C5)-methyltransferase|nr:23S rRNA (uracil(1939)-C(5))-methyltransferase RlmD [Oscillospiraceae bacterium]